MLRCTGCGSTQTIEELRRERPQAISCCPDRWGRGEQRLHPVALERYGYAKARCIGMMAMVGGKDKTKIRNATPPEFRDLLISIANSATRAVAA